MQAREIVIAVFPDAHCVRKPTDDGVGEMHTIYLRRGGEVWTRHESALFAWRLALSKIRIRIDEGVVVPKCRRRLPPRKTGLPTPPPPPAPTVNADGKPKITVNGWLVDGEMQYAAHWVEDGVQKQTELVYRTRKDARNAAIARMRIPAKLR